MKFLKNLFFAAASVATASMLSGCFLIDYLKDSSKPGYDYIAVQQEEDGEWSFLSPEGKILLPDEFKHQPSAVVEGYFSVATDDGYTLYKFDEKKPVPVKNCEDLKYVGAMSDGLIPVVHKKSRIAVVDGDGEQKFILEPIRGKEIVWANESYSDGLLLIRNEEGMHGYVNKKGETVIEPKYDEAFNFIDGYALVGKAKEKEVDGIQFSVIDKEGNKAFDIRKEYMPMGLGFQYGRLFLVDKEDRYAFVDENGEITKLPSRVEGVGMSTKNQYAFKKDGEWGVMDFEGEIIVRPKYVNIQFLKDDKILASKEDKAYILDKKGEELVEITDVKNTLAIEGFGVLGQDGSTFQVYNLEGEALKGAEMYNFGLGLSACYNVQSDFFNYEAMAQDIVGQITAKGIGKYAFDATAANVIGGKPSYSETYTSTKTISDYDIKGYRYSSSLQLYFTQSMANYSYDYWSYSSSYTWNLDSRLYGMNLNISAGAQMGKEAVTPIVNALKKKGFKAITAEGKNLVGMKNGKTLIVIGSKKDSYAVEMQIMHFDDATVLEKNAKEWISNNLGWYEGKEEATTEVGTGEYDYNGEPY